MVKKLKKLPKRDKYLISAIVNLLWYCIAALALVANDKTVPDSTGQFDGSLV